MPDELVRTSSGLANQHLFFGVDLVVYCEGGMGHESLEHAIRNGSDETADAAFWRAVFSVVRPETKVHVKSIGSLKAAEQIAELAAQTGADTVLVCTDADFARVPPAAEDYPNHVRTWSYSWESDLVGRDVLRCVFFRLRSDSARSQQIFQELEDWYSSFLICARPYVHRDIQRVKGGCPALFDRDKPVRSLGESVGGSPKLDEEFLHTQLNVNEYQAEVEFDLEQVSVERQCFGKLIAKACYHALVHYMQKVRKGRIDFDTFVDLAISCFKVCLQNDVVKFDHYNQVLPA